MKTINIDGKEWVSKEDYDLLKDKERGPFKECWNIIDMFESDNKVTALGSFELNSNSYNIVKVSVNYLKKGIKLIEQLDQESVCIGIGTDVPLIIGNITTTGDKKRIVGFAIAPRVE